MLTKEHLHQRKTGLGGSDAAAVVGLSKYATPLDVYLEKTTDTVKKTTEAMERGTILEPFVKSLFEKETGWRVDPVSHTTRSPLHPFMIANLDGVLPSERALAEFKTALYSTKDQWGEPGTDEIPKEYLIQVAHYASVMDCDTVHIGVLFGNDRVFKALLQLQLLREQHGVSLDFEALDCDFALYIYQRNRDLERKLINKEKSFWFDYVEKRVAPKPQEGNIEDLLKAYPVAEDKVVCVGEDEIKTLQEFADLKAQKKQLEDQETLAKSRVLQIFGQASTLVDGSNRLLATWKNKTRTLLNREEFSRHHPDLCSAFMMKSTTRDLRLIEEIRL